MWNQGLAGASLTVPNDTDRAPKLLRHSVWVVRFRLLPDTRWRARYYATREGAMQCARYEARRLGDRVFVDRLEVADVHRDEVTP